MVAALCVQLLDSRSGIVVRASQTIVAHAADLDTTQAIKLISGALGSVAVKKAVMAEAREAAALGVLQYEVQQDRVWNALTTQACTSPLERARAIFIRIVTAWVAVRKADPKRDGKVAAMLRAVLDDRTHRCARMLANC